MDVTTRSLVFLLTDIEGSTRLWDRAEDDMRVALLRHDEIVGTTVMRGGGRLLKARGEGDGTFSVFVDPADAVRSALELQRALVNEPWPARAPLRVRMALHAGEVEERDGDYFGDPVNRCARLRAAAHGGQILVSGAVAESVEPDDGLTFEDLGVHRLRDLTRPERIYQLVHPDLPSSFPPIATLDRRRHNLPAEATSFIGREAETRQIGEMLDRFRLITLTGVGGSGKTRVALHAARDLIDKFPGGVWLIDLASVTRAETIPSAIVEALGLREDSGRSLVESIVEHLQGRATLLLFDNCEHLVGACAELITVLLARSESLQIIATSREILGVPGEAIVNVPPLPVAPGDASGEDRERAPAVQLFFERMALLRRDIPNDPSTEATVAEICRQLDGIPLAIEIAAANTRALGLSAIRSRLADRLGLVGGSGRTSLPRHKTLRALIDWSFDLLRAPERQSLARLSVFAGGWTVESAEEVCAGDELSEPHMDEILSVLADKSMIVVEELDAGGRYRMLETVREYAFERLMQWGEAPYIRDRHIRWARGTVARAAERFGTAQEPDALNALSVEWPNIRAAIDWAIETGDADSAFPMVVELARFLELHGHWTEGIAIIDRVRSLDCDHPMDADALIMLARLLQDAGDPARARDAAEQARTMARARGDVRVEAAANYEIATLVMGEGDYAGSAALMREALEARRALGDRRGIAASLTNLSYPLKGLGDIEGAREALVEALTLWRGAGDLQGISWALTSLSDVAQRLDDLDACRAHNEEALELRYQLGDLRGVADSLTNLAGLWLRRGRPERAFDHAIEAHRLYAQVGYRDGILWSTRNLGLAAFFAGDHDRAATTLAEYLELIGGEPTQGAGAALQVLGVIAVRTGQAAEAVACFSRAHEILRDGGMPFGEPELVDDALDLARSALDPDVFARVWEGARGVDARTLASAVARA